MRQFLGFAAVVLLLSLTGTPAWAGPTYTVTGTFGVDAPNDTFPTGLAGGSFAVTFQFDGSFLLAPNTRTTLDSYNVSLFAADGSEPYAFSDPTGGLGQILGFSNFIEIDFSEPNVIGSAAPTLVLDFASGFTGTGAVVPYADNPDYPSLFLNSSVNVVEVTSGFCSPAVLGAVPEPPSLAMCMIAGLIGLAVALVRCKRPDRSRLALDRSPIAPITT